jgi:hypothetical protein
MMRGACLIGQNWAGTRFTRGSQGPPLLEGWRGEARVLGGVPGQGRQVLRQVLR